MNHVKYSAKIGDKFGSWEVISDFFYPNIDQKVRHVRCVCLCGNESSVRLSTLITGKSTKCTSCASLQRGMKQKLAFRDTSACSVWRGIVSRCKGNDTKHPQYKGMEYINFEDFYREVGDRPDAENGIKYSIDRIDNTKGYIKGNMRWATAKVQNNNRSDNILIGTEKTPLVDVCDKYGLKYNTARNLNLKQYRGDLLEFVYQVKIREGKPPRWQR